MQSNPSSTFNLRVSRKLGRGVWGGISGDSELTLDVFNLFDRKVNDIEYFYESRLPNEAAPVAGKHVHAAEPRTLRLTLQLGF